MSLPKTSSTAVYRARQFFAALQAMLPAWAGGMKAELKPEDKALVCLILPSLAQQQLFEQMSPNDQRHALAVARTLQQAGYDDPALMQAALLHDVGKSMGQPVIHRVLVVLLEAFWPQALHRLASCPAPLNEQPGWRRPFGVHAHHAALGAAWAKERGCEPVAVQLIARHQDRLETEPTRPEDKLLVALQWADNLN